MILNEKEHKDQTTRIESTWLENSPLIGLVVVV